MAKTHVVATDDVLLMLCKAVTKVLNSATGSTVNYSAMVQKIHKTCLKPDLGCFVLFDGGFSGLVVINFTSLAALELYKSYMSNMGMPLDELATQHTSDEVANVLGELMNQMVGDFTTKVGQELRTSINQNQPKMLTINKEVMLSINTNLDRPQARRVTFTTENNNIFYLELAMDKTEFIQLHEFEKEEEINPDQIIESANANKNQSNEAEANALSSDESDSLLDELGYLEG